MYLLASIGMVAIIFGAATIQSQTLQATLNDILSVAIHQYLLWRYPIRHKTTGQPIPTCPYRWPNGQGDIGKFLEGIENSSKWSKQYGSVYRIWSGMKGEMYRMLLFHAPINEVRSDTDPLKSVITAPEHLHRIFKDSDCHRKAENNNSGYLMSQLLGKCVGLVSGRQWRSVRTVMEHPFLRPNVMQQVGLIQKRVNEYMGDLWKTGSLRQGLIDPAGDLKLLPFLIVAEMFYGELTDAMIAELKALAPVRERLFQYVIRGGLSRFSWSRFIPTPANATLAEFQARWVAFNDNACRRCRSLGAENVPIVQMYRAVQDKRITAEQLHQTLDEALYANLDVTLGGLSWNLVFLAAHPKYQAGLQDEAQGHSDNDMEFSRYTMDSSTLLSSCISESARLKPLAAFSVPQSAPTDREVDGYVIPTGTNYVVDSYGLNVRDEFWGHDRESYRPERFVEKNRLDLRYHFWRFGFGPRQCMGKYAADLIIRLIILHLVQNYALSLVDDEDWERDPETWITHPMLKLNCVRKGQAVDHKEQRL